MRPKMGDHPVNTNTLEAPEVANAARESGFPGGAAHRSDATGNPAPFTSESEVIIQWFRALAMVRGAWLQRLWLGDITKDGGASIGHGELALRLADMDRPEAEREWQQSNEEIQGWLAERRRLEALMARVPGLKTSRLGRDFGLSKVEVDLLRLCAAVALDPSLGRVCAYLQDHVSRSYVSDELAARLLGIGRVGPWVPDMKVFQWEWVVAREGAPGEPRALCIDPLAKAWIQDSPELDARLVGITQRLSLQRQPLPEWPVTEVAAWIRTALGVANPSPMRVVVTAPRGAGRRHFATAVGAALNHRVLLVDADAIDEGEWRRVYLKVQRQAHVEGAAIAWTGESLARRSWPSAVTSVPLHFVLCEPGSEPPASDRFTERRIALPMPGPATRHKLWREASPATAAWPVPEVVRLAEQQPAWPGDIMRAARGGARTPGEAADILRSAIRGRFDGLAQVLECPFGMDDMVLPTDVRRSLQSILSEASLRTHFWQKPAARRLFPQGRGLTALFAGPPGTGKTMAAQVIAAALGKDLCRVNVAQLVSKWVGETAKNCERILRVAAESNSVLFFDEADGLFARRAQEVRDAQDRFANTDAAFLLQAIEAFDGIVILASNLRSNIDTAFQRRLRHIVEFPRPDKAQQRDLWHKFVAVVARPPRAAALAPPWEALVAAAEAPGAPLKYAVLSACFAAQAEGVPLGVGHLFAGIDRELGKENRPIQARDRDRILQAQAAP